MKLLFVVKNVFVSFNDVSQPKNNHREEPALLVGFFTPDRINFVDKNTKKKFINQQLKREFVHILSEKLPNHLSLYDVQIITQTGYPKIKLGEKIT